MVQQFDLDVGAKVLCDNIESSEVASIGYWFLHGSRDESESERGYSHFLEHMLFKGTKKRTAFQIVQEIDRVGGILNGFTEKETTCYYCTMPKEYLRLSIDILTDIVFNSVLDPAEIEKEKQVVINEILSILDTPEELAYEHFVNRLWHRHPLAQSITGTVEHIKGITKEKLEVFYKERYNVSNLIISIAGDFDVKQMLETIGEKLASFNKDKYIVERTPPVRQPSWEYIEGRFNQVQIFSGAEFNIWNDKLHTLYSIMVFSTLVGESMSSRLFQEIREKKALCYSILTSRSLYSDTFLWTIYTSTAPEQVIDIITALNNELIRLLKNLPNKNEIEDAKTHLKGHLILAKFDMETRMKRLVRIYAFLGDLLEYTDSIKNIDLVNEESIVEITKELIKSDRFNLTAFGSKGIKDFNKYCFNF